MLLLKIKLHSKEVSMTEKRQKHPASNTLVHRNANSKSQVIISPNKDEFVFLQNKGKPFVVMTSFSIDRGNFSPCLRVPINRISHAQSILKLLPGGVILNSDGNWISIDIISKIIDFESATLKGFIQYQLVNKTDLTVHKIVSVYKEITHNITQYVMLDVDQNEIQPDTLNISSIMLDRGSLVCITDAIEKVLLIPVKDTKTGFIGCIKKPDIKLFNIYKRIWPELRFKVERKNDKYCVYSKIFKYDLTDLPGEFYIRVHRNYGGSDLQLQVTHELMQTYVEESIDYSIECNN